jgi:hypothetical protein
MTLALISRSRLTLVVPADSLMNRLRLTGAFPATAFSALGDLLVDPALVQRARVTAMMHERSATSSA